METVRLGRVWFRPGAERAARQLFEIRWEARHQGDVVIATFDARGPLGAMVAAVAVGAPDGLYAALRAPVELRAGHPIDPVQ